MFEWNCVGIELLFEICSCVYEFISLFNDFGGLKLCNGESFFVSFLGEWKNVLKFWYFFMKNWENKIMWLFLVIKVIWLVFSICIVW